MPRGHSRVALLAALHFLIICLLPSTTTSNSMAIESLIADAPSVEEIALFEELAEWIDDSPPATERRLRSTIRTRAMSFDVFLSHLGDPVRYQRLSSVPFGDEIRRASAEHGVDALLVASIIEAESSFNPCAISHRGAVGLMQVMPATAGSEELANLTDPALNIDHGAGYLRHLLNLYEGDLELALAAYNAGPSNVRRYGGLPPFRETRQYVERVLGLYVDHHREAWQSSGAAQEIFGFAAPAQG